jgi:lysozyme
LAASILTNEQIQILRSRLTRTEGRTAHIYDDTTGKAPVLATGGKVTVGIGHNLSDKGIPDHIIELLFVHDLNEAAMDAQTLVAFAKLDAIRQTVLVDMVFNMGLPKVKGFVNTLGHMAAGRWALAADGMLNSLWAKQVGNRAIELAEIMRTGEIKHSKKVVA